MNYKKLIFAYYEQSQKDLTTHRVALDKIVEMFGVDEIYWAHQIALKFPYRLMECRECGKIFKANRSEKWLYCEEHRGLSLAIKRGIKKCAERQKRQRNRMGHVYRVAI